METALLDEVDKTNANHIAAQRVHSCEASLEALRKQLNVDGREHVEQAIQAYQVNLAELQGELKVANIDLQAARSEIDRLRALYLSASDDEDQSNREREG
jgi:ABC-type phosphate transport system auxiliary subunit